MADTAVRGQLASNAVGLREVLFQSITHMAPGAAVAFSIIVGAQFAGGALPLSVIFALVGCLFVAVSIGQLAKHLPSAAGFGTYASQGLHPSIGFLVVWGYALAEAMVAPLLYLIFGHTVAGTLEQEYGWEYATWWPIATVAAAVFVFLLGWFGIRLSAGAGTVLGLFEIVVFAALAIWLIVKAGDNNTFEVFGTNFANAEGFNGMSGVIAGSVFAILAFIGFEAAAPLAEEARNPGRTVQVAVVASAALIGLFYILTTYAAAVYFGPGEFTTFAGFGDGNPWQQMARDVWGGAWVLIFVAIIISALANSNAGSNATTRTWYALGRGRILTSLLTETHPRWQSPYVGLLAQFVLALGIALPLGFIYDPYPTAFGLVGTLVTVVVVLIYIVMNLACFGYYAGRRRSEFNWILHLVVPLLGVLAFIPAMLTALGIETSLFDFIASLTWPYSLAAPVVGGWLGLGLLYLIYLLVSGKRDRLASLGLVYGGEAAAVAATVPDAPPTEPDATATATEPEASASEPETPETPETEPVPVTEPAGAATGPVPATAPDAPASQSGSPPTARESADDA
ncbi:MAG TPA: APC family permease [Actinomycetes bacterium]|nr:APC family permease [Actinomycetes bacterium]